MRQWFRNDPPFIVPLKCVSQPSCGSTWASAAAMPPSAIQVWALPSSDLHTRPTEPPRADASMAARNPAPPAPMTITSCSWTSSGSIRPSVLHGRHLEQMPKRHEHRVGEHAHRAHAHVEVGEADREQAGPGPPHVVLVEYAHEAP